MKSTLNFKGKIDVSPTFKSRSTISHVLFDFDGTLSLIREGWSKVMTSMFMEMLPRLSGETEEQAKNFIFEGIMKLNGKQTIYQMIQLAEQIKERGGKPQEPLWYKKEYLQRLNSHIDSRKNDIRNKKSKPDEFLVYQSRYLLEKLKQRGLNLYLASGTDEIYVLEEAKLLNVDLYFQDKIYGALDDYKKFSKKMIIDRILAENKISGEKLLAFGDGYVEIQNTKEIGGLAVAVASDESNNGSGNMDEWKRQRLSGVGADVVIADYRDTDVLLELIFGDQ